MRRVPTMSPHTFEVPCPTCGLVQLDCDQLWLVLAPSPAPDHIAFHCPGCGTLRRNHAGRGAVALLSDLVAVEELDIPAEALEPRDSEPLTEDHLIEMMLGLDRWTSLPPAAGPRTRHDPR
jgi:predicted RNA-binding Zn-ribbon protein involved in translation (DUF1610 family)